MLNQGAVVPVALSPFGKLHYAGGSGHDNFSQLPKSCRLLDAHLLLSPLISRQRIINIGASIGRSTRATSRKCSGVVVHE